MVHTLPKLPEGVCVLVLVLVVSVFGEEDLPRFLGRAYVSWDEEGDNIGLLKPLLCDIAVSIGLGASSRYFSVVEGSMAIVLLSPLLLLLFAFFSLGRLFLDCVRFIIIALLSESLLC